MDLRNVGILPHHNPEEVELNPHRRENPNLATRQFPGYSPTNEVLRDSGRCLFQSKRRFKQKVTGKS
jgi:hypothetical protein